MRGYSEGNVTKTIKDKYVAFYNKKLDKKRLIQFLTEYFNLKLKVNPREWCFVANSYQTFAYGGDNTSYVKGEIRPKGLFTRVSVYEQDRSPNRGGRMINTQNIIHPGHIIPK